LQEEEEMPLYTAATVRRRVVMPTPSAVIIIIIILEMSNKELAFLSPGHQCTPKEDRTSPFSPWTKPMAQPLSVPKPHTKLGTDGGILSSPFQPAASNGLGP